MVNSMQSDHLRSKSSRAGSLTWLFVSGVLLVIFFSFSLAGVYLYRNLTNLELQSEIRTQNLAQVFEDSMSGNIGRIDLSLIAIKDQVEEQLASGGIQEKNSTFLSKGIFRSFHTLKAFV